MQNDLFLCGHSRTHSHIVGKTLVCLTCSSFEEKLFEKAPVYDQTYAQNRGHFDKEQGALKAHNLVTWLKKSNYNVQGKNVLETGFGGAYTLQKIQTLGAKAFGIETTQEYLDQAKKLGVPSDHLMLYNERPASLSQKIDLWLFLDSFEHLPQPTEFMEWVKNNSKPDAGILIVLPQADAFLTKVLGRFSPHRLPDHPFHWSKKGLLEFMGQYGFKIQKEFFPQKVINLDMLVKHLSLQRGFKLSHLPLVGKFQIPFNICEMGFYLQFQNKAGA